MGDLANQTAPSIEKVDVSPRVLRGGVKDGREFIRLLIVILLFLIFGGTIGSSIYAAFLNGNAWSNDKDLLNLILPVETALIGTAVAFYMTN